MAKGGDPSTALVTDPVIIDKAELPQTVVYFADTGNWGPDNTQIHIWGSAGDFTTFLSDPTMTDTGKYALVNDVWARVYQYTYLYDGVVEGVMFHLKGNNFSTADYKEMDGAMYAYAGNKKSAPVETAPVLMDAIPHDTPRPVSLYVNLGANQMMQTGLWDEPCAHAYRREDSATDYESLLPEYGSEAYQAEVMTKIRDGFYRIDIDDITACNDVIFYYSRINAQGEHTYQDLAFPASRGAYNDPSTWATFIYDIGIDCVHQSYLTPQEYNVGWEESPEALFLTGNELVMGMAVDDPANSVLIESDDDVYIHKFTISEGDIATFKLSRFDARGAALRHGFSTEDKTYEKQRGWATFNLGIIGFQNDPGDADWYDKYIYAPGNGQSRQVRLWLNESVDFNSSTQYPWRLGDGENGVTEGDYWLVIDLHDEDHSLTLLDFDPNPTSEIANKGFSVAEVGYDYALSLDNTDPHKGEGANGKVGFDRVNVLSANAEVTGRSTDFLKERDFTVAYTAYVGDVAVATLDIPEDGDFESGVMDIPYMASREPFANHLGKYSDTPWIPVSDDMEYGDSNNWSKYVASEGHLPLFINVLTTVDSFDTTVSSTAGLKLHAVYPFLVATEETPAAAPRRVMAKEGEETSAIPAGLSLMTLRTSKDASIEFGGRTISSIDGINADRSVTDEAERYYTIGGVALSSHPSLPGIYVAVKGTSVKKVVIK